MKKEILRFSMFWPFAVLKAIVAFSILMVVFVFYCFFSSLGNVFGFLGNQLNKFGECLGERFDTFTAIK